MPRMTIDDLAGLLRRRLAWWGYDISESDAIDHARESNERPPDMVDDEHLDYVCWWIIANDLGYAAATEMFGFDAFQRRLRQEALLVRMIRAAWPDVVRTWRDETMLRYLVSRHLDTRCGLDETDMADMARIAGQIERSADAGEPLPEIPTVTIDAARRIFLDLGGQGDPLVHTTIEQLTVGELRWLAGRPAAPAQPTDGGV